MSTPRALGSGDLPMADRKDRWLRIVKIMAVSTLIGPLIAGVTLIAVLVVSGWLQGSAMASDEVFSFALTTMTMTCVIGVPYALLTSSVFALAAILVGWRQLVVAWVIALVPFVVIFFNSVFIVFFDFDNPTWPWEKRFFAAGFILIVVSTTICWLLTRRWHSRTA